MKRLILLAGFFALACGSQAQTANPHYDAALAKSLGADEYGMKPYVLVLLKTGSNNTQDKETVQTLFRGHMGNIERLAREGKLVLAGPLGKNENAYRGIFIFNVQTIEQAKALVDTDPAVKEKLLEAEFYQWYGSAALPEYLKVHEKIEKIKP